MQKDKFKALWVSHSSIGDFLKCPRLYYFRNIYKDPLSGHKITLMNPPLALGQAVHDTIESLSRIPCSERFRTDLEKKFAQSWQKVTGKKGGFKSKEEESREYERGIEMIRKIKSNPGPLLNKAIKIKSQLPWYWLSLEEEIILCGKIDWIEYNEETNNVHIIDFKTGRVEEDDNSLQLPIYLLLASNTQKRAVEKASYWYLERNDSPTTMKLPDIASSYDAVYKEAKRIKLARQLEHFKCPKGGCKYCTPIEHVANGKGELVGLSEYNQDIYIL